ncbi:MAG: aldo/keto reductase, partial [Candidatus Eremiobacteraeota bacterium]|nr:aldo/keto reductase [Candidatus Eremiobacteraeota bacterium]
MQKVEFGNTGITVSRLVFGTLTMGPWQANLPVPEGAKLLKEAYRLGIDLFDTAQAYNTYQYFKEAFNKDTGFPHLMSRSYAVTYNQMKEAVMEAKTATGFPEILCFMLHEQESIMTLRGHKGALKFLQDAKKHGLIRSIGLSTHKPEGVLAAMEEDSIEVIFALLNLEGIGLDEGKFDEMLQSLKSASGLGKTVILMKVLAGGHLFKEVLPALEWARDLSFSPLIAVGMQNIAEIKVNISIMSGERPSPEILEK